MQSREKHTPGEWRVSDDAMYGGLDYTLGVYDLKGNKIATIHGHDSDTAWPTKTQTLNNARLIAAAPDMLAALKQIVIHHCRFDDLTDEAAAALRAARKAYRAATGEK